MTNTQDTRTFAGKSAADCYQAAVTALPKAGFPIWKLREIANLVMAKRGQGSAEVSCNVSARPGGTVTVAVSGNEPDAVLHGEAAKVLDAMQAILG